MGLFRSAMASGKSKDGKHWEPGGALLPAAACVLLMLLQCCCCCCCCCRGAGLLQDLTPLSPAIRRARGQRNLSGRAVDCL